MEIIFHLLFLCWALFCVYSFYQFFRNNAVYEIRSKWRLNNDLRFYAHTYDEMFNPSLKNIYGLKFPKDKHFK